MQLGCWLEQVLRKFNIEFCKEESRLDNNIQDVPTRIDVLNAKKVSKKKKKKRNLVFGINQVWKSFKYKSIWLIIILDTNVISMENYFNIKKWFLFYNVILKCLNKWINIFKKIMLYHKYFFFHSFFTYDYLLFACINYSKTPCVLYIYKYVCEVMLRKIQSVRFYIEKFLDNSTLSCD